MTELVTPSNDTLSRDSYPIKALIQMEHKDCLVFRDKRPGAILSERGHEESHSPFPKLIPDRWYAMLSTKITITCFTLTPYNIHSWDTHNTTTCTISSISGYASAAGSLGVRYIYRDAKGSNLEEVDRTQARNLVGLRVSNLTCVEWI